MKRFDELVVKDVLYSADQIRERVKELAAYWNTLYGYPTAPELVLLVTLKGAYTFAADLSRHITVPHVVEFIRASSYLGGTESTGSVQLSELSSNLTGKNVLIIEDILDSGLTLKRLNERVKEHKPNSIRYCAILSKPSCLEHQLACDGQVGFAIDPPRFVIGYGLDYKEHYRGLPHIYEAALN